MGEINDCNTHREDERFVYKILVANRGRRDCFVCLEIYVGLMLKQIIKNSVVGKEMD